MSFLINGKLDWLGELRNSDPSFIKKVVEIKVKMGPKEICVGSSKCILPFVIDIFNLKFHEEPCYSKLKHHLIKVLLTNNLCPDNIFDWSKLGGARNGSVYKGKVGISVDAFSNDGDSDDDDCAVSDDEDDHGIGFTKLQVGLSS